MEMRAIARYWLFPTPPTPTLHSRCSLDVHINLTRIAISLFNAVAHKGGGRKEGGGGRAVVKKAERVLKIKH